MAADIDNEAAVDQQVYLAGDIQRMLGIGKSKAYTFLEDVYKQKKPPFRVQQRKKWLPFMKETRGFTELNCCSQMVL